MAEPIALPPAAVAQAATSVESTAKSVAALVFWLDGLFALGAIAMTTREPRDLGTMVFGFGFWVVLLTWCGLRFVRRARVAGVAGRIATTDASTTWLLQDRMIVAVDAAGIPAPARSFKISRKLRAVLTAVPSARVVAG
jgi:hypothetical protein